MAESIVDTPKNEIETGEPGKSEPVLEVSISFGRFENDSLSWERWSSFSPNKYLEEVEKFSTPGSVAQKKAYFEAHYKKIAARKAELLEEETKMEDDFFRSDEPSFGDLVSNGCENNTGFDPSNVETITETRDLETNSVSEISSNHANDWDEPNQDSEMAIEGQGSFGEEVKELISRSDSPKSNKSEVGILAKEENQENKSMESQALMESPHRSGNETDNTLENKVDEAKLNQPKVSQKGNSATKEKSSVRTKKKPVSPVPKSPQISTPRATMAATPATVMTGNRTSIRGGNLSSEQRKKSTPIPLHRSLNLGASNSDSPSLTTSRRSFIMEKMGDKEIVRRAFKTFQNSFNQLRPTTTNSSIPQQVSKKGTEQNVDASSTLHKNKDGMKKSVEKASARKGQVGAKGNSISARPLKVAGANQNNAKASPSPSFALRSDERAEKRREFFKKLEEKSNAIEAEKTHLQSKTKDQKEAEIKKLRQSLNFKATPMPEFYKGQRISKANVNKGVKNDGNRHQP